MSRKVQNLFNMSKFALSSFRYSRQTYGRKQCLDFSCFISRTLDVLHFSIFFELLKLLSYCKNFLEDSLNLYKKNYVYVVCCRKLNNETICAPCLDEVVSQRSKMSAESHDYRTPILSGIKINPVFRCSVFRWSLYNSSKYFKIEQKKLQVCNNDQVLFCWILVEMDLVLLQLNNR